MGKPNKDSIELMASIALSSGEPVNTYEREHLATLVDIVNENEIYLLKKNPDFNPGDANSPAYIRGRRICGSLRRRETQLRCLRPAGHKTNHSGYGRCLIHEKMREGSVTRYSRVLKGYAASGFALDLKELEELYPELLDDPRVDEIREEILILERVFAKQINDPVITAGELRSTALALAKVKALKSKMETDKLLIDINSIRVFVRSLLEVVRNNVGTVQYSRIAEELEEKLTFPINKPMQRLLETRATIAGKDGTEVDA
jgi:hypothetical protein